MVGSRAAGDVRRWFLIGSILLNLFLVAVIGGHFLRHDTVLKEHETLLAVILENAEARLSIHDAAEFRSTLQQAEPQYRQARLKLIDARAEVDRQLGASRFDASATRQAITQWRLAWNDFVGDFSNALVDAISKLSPEGRRAVVATLWRQRQSAAR